MQACFIIDTMLAYKASTVMLCINFSHYRTINYIDCRLSYMTLILEHTVIASSEENLRNTYGGVLKTA